MRLSFQEIGIGSIYFACLLGIARVFLFLFYVNNQTTSVNTLSTIQLRDIYDVTGNVSLEDKYEDESWKDWRKDRFKNDRLFLSAFQTLHSDLSLQNYRTEGLGLVLCVFSSPYNGGKRGAVRKTWANPSLMSVQNATVWFILGQSIYGEENSKVLKEKEKFGDIIIGNFTDSKGNETLKLLFSLNYAIASHPSVKEIYFGYDSTYVHIQHLLKKFMFRKNSGIGQWRGYVMKGMKPERDKKNPFYVSEGIFNESVYPTFCTLHNGFTLSSSCGKKILLLARNERLFLFPDVFLGMLAQKTNLKIVEDVSFGSQLHFPYSNLCELRSSMTTYTFDVDLVESWKSLTNHTKLRECFMPDVDIVLPNMTDNRPYFNKVLKYLNNNGKTCSDHAETRERTFIIALISSYIGNFQKRLAIRETIGSKNTFNGRVVRTLFVLGKSMRRGYSVQAKVNEEAKMYGDIIQGNFYDSFRNLTLKVVLGLKWVTEFCPDAAYLYKGDEDMFVAWSRIVLFLLHTSDQKGVTVMDGVYLGAERVGMVRVRDPRNKYYVNESIYHGHYYPRYCSGGSYILSMDIVPELYKWSLHTPLIPIDDAYQGILAEKIGVHPTHHNGFKVYSNKTACILQDPETYTLHGFKSVETLRNAWFDYTQKRKAC